MIISVALCTHNGAAYIETQLRSIFNQTLPPHEIVVSDDASSDETLAIVSRISAEYKAKYHPTDLTVLRNLAPLGVVANFEQAICATSGDYIALSDQDDIWVHNKLEVLIELFRQDDDLLLVHTNAQLVDSGGRPMGLSLFAALGISQSTVKKEHEGNGFALLMRRNIVTGATVLFRRSLVTSVLPFPKRWVHDEWLAIMAAALGKIDVSEDELVEYRQHSNNQIGATALTLKGRWARLTRAREDRNRLLLGRAEDLFARLEQLSNHVSPANIQLAHHKVEHEKRRNSLPARRWARILPVMLEAATGRYRTMGSGANDVLRDLVQPSLKSKQIENASS